MVTDREQKLVNWLRTKPAAKPAVSTLGVANAAPVSWANFPPSPA